MARDIGSRRDRIFIVLFSFFLCSLPIANYVKDSVILQDLEQNIFNVSNSYWYIVNIDQLSLFDYFKKEYLWSFFTVRFSVFFDSLEAFFSFVGFINYLVASLFIYEKTKKVGYIFFLIVPIEIVFLLYQPRLAFACSVWLVGIMCYNKKIKYLLFFMTLLIHNAMFVILGSYFVISRIYYFKKSKKYKIFFVIFYSLIVNFIVGPLVTIFYSLLGNKDVVYDNADFASSLISFVFWLGISLLFTIDICKKLKPSLSTYIALFFTLFPVFSFVLSSGYPYRFLTVGYPFVLIAIYRSKSRIKFLLLSLLILFIIISLIGFVKF